VEIGPYSVIHRGTLDSTVIDSGVKAGAYTNIGHNSYIGKNTVCAVRVTINGSVEIGNQCWLSSNVTIRNNIKITDKVIIGTGAVVVKDITESGIYVGNPAKKIKPYKEGWNF
jgi:UDP-3-O-[3-hydroxymyristoyl] glucosamine N-acyltransferase